MRWKRVSGNCERCGAWRRSLHREHRIAKMNGGSDDESNIQRLCANCHEDKTAEDWAWRREHMPKRKLTPEHRAKIGAAMKGRRATDETRATLSAAHKGRRLTDAHKEAIRQGHLRRRTR